MKKLIIAGLCLVASTAYITPAFATETPKAIFCDAYIIHKETFCHTKCAGISKQCEEFSDLVNDEVVHCDKLLVDFITKGRLPTDLNGLDDSLSTLEQRYNTASSIDKQTCN